jgi:AraC-like DNA-binding protein
MNKIQVHKTRDLFPGEMVSIRHISEQEHEQLHTVDYAHRDDYYIFILLEKGYAKLVIDFEEYEFAETSVLCILPGQVHFPIEHSDICGWFLAVDSMLVKDEYKKIFEQISFIKNKPELNEEIINDLKYCASMIQRKFNRGNQPVGQSIAHALLSSYIGMIAEIYQKGFPVPANNRLAVITFQFKSLLSDNYKSTKSPSQYAAKLNISPVYLNEAVKKTTGLTVSDYIQNEIITQAKRLLFYTNMSIKEIALELGYEDWAYFTRLFSKASAISPRQFRKKHLK